MEEKTGGLRVIVAVFLAFSIVRLSYPAEGETSPRAESQRAREILDASGIRGGLVVHLGCGDGKLTAALRAGDGYLVHGLDRNARSVEMGREHIKSLGLYGKVSVELWRGEGLPYIDNLVNLVVADEPVGAGMDEVLRVLAPNGVAYLKAGEKWTRTVKGRPDEIDEWTHYLHDATGNAVGRDLVVGPPRRLQWVGSPRWSRHHDHMASMSALVSAGGRIFYIFDEGPTASIRLPSKWSLIARDGFNGTVLWKRPIAAWNTQIWPLKSGPAQLPRRLVAVEDKVYVTLGLDAPLTALDAATGQTVRTYKETANTEEIVASEGVLFLLVTDSASKWPQFRQKHSYVWDNSGRANREWAWDEVKRRIMAVRAETGSVLWQKEYAVAPLTLAADARAVYFHDGQKALSLDRGTGEELWSSEPVSRRTSIVSSFGPTLVVYKDVVLFSGGDRLMTALSAESGKTLWSAKHPRSGHQSPEDLLVVNDLVWSGAIANGGDSGVFTGRDLHSGQVETEFPPDVDTYWFHHRCYRSKATDRYLLPSRTGIEFIDFRSKHWITNHWVRGGCIYGIMPCNGLVYAPPHSCACYIESKLYGFCALAPEGEGVMVAGEQEDRLECGPAYGEGIAARPGPGAADEWPTYRHDAARSGFTKASVAARLEPAWQTDLPGELTGVVVAEGRLLVASAGTHTVYALDSDSGKSLWSYTAGGRVDSPPTVYEGRVLFGSADGHVYCVSASEGRLIWRFRAAPQDRRLVAFEQVESVWPVHGSVLVQDGAAYCIAGRSMFLDGGLRLLRLDAKTGRMLSEKALDDRDPETGENLQVHVKGLNMPVALADILSSDGRRLYMRSQCFDLEGNRRQIAPQQATDQQNEGAHLFCTIGFLDDSWFHRSYWMFGTTATGGYGGWFRAGRLVPSGRLLVADESCVYGYGRRPEYLCNASVLEYHLYSAEKNIDGALIDKVTKATSQINAKSKKRNADASDWELRQGFAREQLSAALFRWSTPEPALQARAMVMANKTLFVAGPPDVVDEQASFYRPDEPAIAAKLKEQAAALIGQRGGLLWAVAAENGKKLAEYRLDSVPVWDGMAAANGRLYVSMKNGGILCMKGRQSEAAGSQASYTPAGGGSGTAVEHSGK
jgi:outer membrane protein assembly factor BamB